MKIWKLRNALKFAPIATLALPISVAASCSDTLETLSSEQLTANGKLANTKEVVELFYQEKLLKTINTSFDNTSYETIFNSKLSTAANSNAFTVGDVAKYYINQKIYANKDYLKTYGQALLTQSQEMLIKTGANKDPVKDANGNYYKVQYADLYRYRLLDEIAETGRAWITLPAQNALFEELVKQMLKNNLNNFKNEFYQLLIVFNYLDITKENWNSVFHVASTDKLYKEYASTDVEIDDATFNLVRNVIKLRPFYTWTASLTEEQSQAYVDKKALPLAEVDAFISNTTPAEGQFPINYSAKNKLAPSYLEPIMLQTTSDATNLKSLMSFSGLQSRGGVGYKSLSFSASELRNVTSDATYDKAYVGYVFDNELRREKIDLFASGSKTVSVTRVAGVMPRYESSKFNVKKFDANYLKMMLYFLSSQDLYDEAITYYTNKPNPIKLQIVDKYFEKLAIDSFGFKFVEKSAT